MSEQRTHHKHGMSKLNYLDDCPGFESRPGTNEYAEEGQTLHDHMETAAKLVGFDPKNRTFRGVLRDVHLEDDTQRGLLQFCCDEADQWLKRGYINIETELKVHIYEGCEEPQELNHGHLDLLMLNDPGTSAILVDYKYGWLPVPKADRNYQGMGYALACFQKFPKLEKIGAIFIQPKLGTITRKVYTRADMPRMYELIKGIIDRAESENKTLRPGSQCDFCAKAGVCAALANNAVTALQKFEPLPMPITFLGLKLETPEDVMKALYVRARLKNFFDENEELDAKAKDMLRAAGGKLEFPLPDGRTMIAQLKERSGARSANSPLLIADALAPALGSETAMQVVLASCDPQITKLEQNFADKYVSLQKAKADDLTGQGKAEEARGFKVTKKQAKEMLDATLRSEGLLTSPDRKVEYVKVQIEKPLLVETTVTTQPTNNESNIEKDREITRDESTST